MRSPERLTDTATLLEMLLGRTREVSAGSDLCKTLIPQYKFAK